MTYKNNPVNKYYQQLDPIYDEVFTAVSDEDTIPGIKKGSDSLHEENSGEENKYIAILPDSAERPPVPPPLPSRSSPPRPFPSRPHQPLPKLPSSRPPPPHYTRCPPLGTQRTTFSPSQPLLLSRAPPLPQKSANNYYDLRELPPPPLPKSGAKKSPTSESRLVNQRSQDESPYYIQPNTIPIPYREKSTHKTVIKDAECTSDDEVGEQGGNAVYMKLGQQDPLSIYSSLVPPKASPISDKEEQAVTKHGENRYSILHPKFKHDGYIVRQIKTESTYGMSETIILFLS